MLVLSRKQKQQIKIGNDVVVTVLQIKGGSVRIGIEAPREVHVMRAELEEFRDHSPEPAPARPKVLAMTNQDEAYADEETGESAKEEPANEETHQKILELRFHGGDESGGPTRLTEIANTISSINLPR